MFQVKELLSRILLAVHQEEKGQTLIEYALLVVLIAVVVIVALLVLGPQINTVFENIRTDLGGI